jgi:hypothetical protein
MRLDICVLPDSFLEKGKVSYHSFFLKIIGVIEHVASLRAGSYSRKGN